MTAVATVDVLLQQLRGRSVKQFLMRNESRVRHTIEGWTSVDCGKRLNGSVTMPASRLVGEAST